MSIPDYESLMLPLLRLVENTPGQELATVDATKALADEFALSQEERAALLPSGGTFMFASRVGWASTYLKKAGLLEATKRGRIHLTARGQSVLKAKPTKIDNEFLDRFPEFREFRSRGKKEGEKLTLTTTPAVTGTPEEVIAAQFDLLQNALATQLLEVVKATSPQFFERLVITLLVSMGYGGSFEEAAMVVGKSGDGGIDGVIKEDILGLDMVYVQAKCWDDKPVGSPQIDQFAGALQKKKAQKGVFITTSTFTADAIKSVKEYPLRIVLIDGPTLAKYMIAHNIGVTPVVPYVIKRLDSDFFDASANVS